MGAQLTAKFWPDPLESSRIEVIARWCDRLKPLLTKKSSWTYKVRNKCKDWWCREINKLGGGCNQSKNGLEFCNAKQSAPHCVACKSHLKMSQFDTRRWNWPMKEVWWSRWSQNAILKSIVTQMKTDNNVRPLTVSWLVWIIVRSYCDRIMIHTYESQ